MIDKQIKTLRKALKMTQEEFSAKLGMSSSSVYDWEQDRVQIKESTLLLIEFIYNVNPEWLRKGKGEMFKPTLTPKLERFVDWMKSLSDSKKAWLEVELEEKIKGW